MGDADAAVLRAIEVSLLNGDMVARAIAYAERALTAEDTADDRKVITADLETTDAAIRRLTAAIAEGVEPPSVLVALGAQEQRRAALQGRLQA